jgi:hypothetical protein
VSGVIIRCPNCGTTQSTLGECEACHEAGTRYFCTNHEPGRWLDGPACAVCGARYGMEPATSRPAPRTQAEPPVSWTPSSRPVDEPERVPVDVWSGPVRTPGGDDVFEIEPPGVELPDRRAGPPLPAESLTLEATAAGCARRIIVLFLILLVLAALTIFGLLGVGIRLL